MCDNEQHFNPVLEYFQAQNNLPSKKEITMGGKEEHSESEDEHSHAEDIPQEDQLEEEEVPEDSVIRAARPKKVHRLSLTETENFNAKLKKRGVVYIARIPPRMTPTKVKALLTDFSEVTRVYLKEEDPTVRKRRKKEHGGSGGKRYTEGWVEFSNKKKAKHIAQSLNNTAISNHKRNPHYGKFLIDFSFFDLQRFVLVPQI